MVNHQTNLNRSLSLPVVALYGLGNILGAGIYVLVGKVAGFAGEGTILAFVLAMITATFTAFSYMELSGRYPVSASVSVYLHKAYKQRWLSVTIGLAMVVGGIASASALAQGFSGYFRSFIDLPQLFVSLGLIVALGLVALKGIGESAKTAGIFTAVEIVGLLLVIWFGKNVLSDFNVGQLTAIDPGLGVSGLVAGAFLAFYAFIGFEDMVNVAEEAKNPRRTMPLAILIALVASTILYLLVVIVSINVVPTSELAESEAPLTLVLERSGVANSRMLSVIGLAATLNGVIVQIIMGSRILYGLANQGWISRSLAQVSPKNHTPTKATVLVVSLMLVATILLPIVSLAQITSFLVLSIFTLVNLALIKIKRDTPIHAGYVTVPIVVPIIGTVLCLGTLGYQIYSWFPGA